MLHIRPAFEAAVKDAGVVGHFIGADAEPALGSDFAHCVDLIVASRPEGEARKLVREEVPDRVLIEAGAPMLILPQDWAYGPLGENVVIAWNASREADARRPRRDAAARESQEGDDLQLLVARASRSGLRRSASPIICCATASPPISPTGPTPATSRRSRRCSPASTPRTPT